MYSLPAYSIYMNMCILVFLSIMSKVYALHTFHKEEQFSWRFEEPQRRRHVSKVSTHGKGSSKSTIVTVKLLVNWACSTFLHCHSGGIRLR